MWLEKLDFWGWNHKTIKLDYIEKRLQMFPMLLNKFWKNNYIIYVNSGVIGEWIENLIHDVLEFIGCIL